MTKPNGGWRLVINYKALNVTVPDTIYLINCGEAIGNLGKDKLWLSKSDLVKWFWSIRQQNKVMEKLHSHITVISLYILDYHRATKMEVGKHQVVF